MNGAANPALRPRLLWLARLACVSLVFGVLIGFTVLGNLLFWGWPKDQITLTTVVVMGLGASLAVPVLYLLRSWVLPAGGDFKWFLITFVCLSVLTGAGANGSFLLYHFFNIPHSFAPPTTELFYFQFAFTGATAELVFLAQLPRFALPFTPIALILCAALFNRHFLMLHGVR